MICFLFGEVVLTLLGSVKRKRGQVNETAVCTVKEPHLNCHGADDHWPVIILPFPLGVGYSCLWSWREKFLFPCYTRKSDWASTYLEVGRISVKSVWCWVETEFSGILVCSEIKGPRIHRMGNVGARGSWRGKHTWVRTSPWATDSTEMDTGCLCGSWWPTETDQVGGLQLPTWHPLPFCLESMLSAATF